VLWFQLFNFHESNAEVMLPWSDGCLSFIILIKCHFHFMLQHNYFEVQTSSFIILMAHLSDYLLLFCSSMWVDCWGKDLWNARVRYCLEDQFEIELVLCACILLLCSFRFGYHLPFSPVLCSCPAVCSHSSSGWLKWHIWRNAVNGETVKLLS
jgi:hypothetical protein